MSRRGEQLKKMGKQQLIDEILGLEVLLEQQMKAAPGTGPEVEVQGIVSHRTREPLVQMRAGEAAWTMTTAQTRQHAMILLDAAVEAERDAATVAFIMDEMGMEDTAAGSFLQSMRNHRVDWFKEFYEMGHITPPKAAGDE